ncbi:MAG: hypothetical protein ACYCPD_16485, partial [Acidobacteriaceae bacterium]
TAGVVLAALAYRWRSDFLPLESSEINRATKADAAAGNFARGSFYLIFSVAIKNTLPTVANRAIRKRQS